MGSGTSTGELCAAQAGKDSLYFGCMCRSQPVGTFNGIHFFIGFLGTISSSHSLCLPGNNDYIYMNLIFHYSEYDNIPKQSCKQPFGYSELDLISN